MDDSIAPPPPHRLPVVNGTVHQLQQPSAKRPQTHSRKPKGLPAAAAAKARLMLIREGQHNVVVDGGGEHGLDALLANAGYSVRSSDVAHVAERLAQLETVLCAAEGAGLSHLSSDSTVHYNPSDLAGWIESMIGELVSTSTASADNMGPSSSGSGGGGYCTSHHGSSNNENSSLDCTAVSPNIIPSTDISQGHCISLEDVSYPDVMEELDDLISRYQEEIHGHSSHSLTQFTPPGPSASTTRTPLCPVPLSAPEIAQSRAQLESRSSTQPAKPLHPPHSSLSVDHHEKSFPDGSLVNSYGFLGHPQHIQQAFDLNSRHNLKSQTITHAVDHKQFYAGEEELGCPTDQENGVRVVHLLIACAGAVQKAELQRAHDMVKEIQALSYPQANGAMAKVAAHFVEALARRIYGASQLHQQPPQVDAYTDLLYFHYYETCPYLKFAHFTANQAILEAFQGQKMVHVIDFSLMQGLQWPALIQALALRPGGPPQRLRLTGIGPPQPDDKDVLQEVGMKLAQLADSVKVEFDFRGVVATKLNDVQPWMLQVQRGEAVAVNSIFQLHRLLHCDCNTLNAPPIEEVLQAVRSLNPKIITVVEQEANHNNPFFLERFMEALQYYCTMFDSIEASKGGAGSQSMEVALAEMHLGREIMNIVACEGGERFERHETLAQWRLRMTNAGFQPLHLGSNAFKQTSTLLTLFSGEGYTVQESNGCLTLGWHSHPLLSASAWSI